MKILDILANIAIKEGFDVIKDVYSIHISNCNDIEFCVYASKGEPIVRLSKNMVKNKGSYILRSLLDFIYIDFAKPSSINDFLMFICSRKIKVED